MNRRERRAEAKKNKVEFVPQYNGRKLNTYEEYHGVGYERFNNKFVTIKEEPEALKSPVVQKALDVIKEALETKE